MSSMENTPINPEAAKTMDDIFGARKVDLTAGDSFQPLEEVQAAFEHKDEASPVKPAGFKPKAPKGQTARIDSATQQNVIVEDTVTPQRLKALEDAIRVLKAGQNGVKMSNAPKKPAPIDFTKISEADVFDLEIPIEAIDHGTPEYLTVNLKDKNYVARWVHKAPRRLGPMKAVGWTFITKEDLEDSTVIEFAMDENGLYRYDDVIAMKCTKASYFGQLRKNHERTLAQSNPKALHKRAQSAVQAAMNLPENIGLNEKTGHRDTSRAGDFDVYSKSNKLEVYEPLAQD